MVLGASRIFIDSLKIVAKHALNLLYFYSLLVFDLLWGLLVTSVNRCHLQTSVLK